jgi:putative transposase
MLVFEAKLQGTSDQRGRLDDAIRTSGFVRNMCLRYWLDVDILTGLKPQ